MKKGIILLGSSNSNGETAQIAHYIQAKTNFKLVDLKTKNIGHFDYEFGNQQDDFLPLMRHIVDHYELIIFATPVYWYTMSGITKVLLDRFSDLLKLEKDTGRKLRGMQMAVVSCGYDKELKEGFQMPFIESAKYLGMEYIGDVHTYLREAPLSEEMKKRVDTFIAETSYEISQK